MIVILDTLSPPKDSPVIVHGGAIPKTGTITRLYATSGGRSGTPGPAAALAGNAFNRFRAMIFPQDRHHAEFIWVRYRDGSFDNG